MKVLVADQFERSGIEGLTAAGCDVIHDPALKDEALTAALAQTRADVLVVRSTRVTAEMLEGGSLTLVVRAGAGYNTIDVGAASARGIYVSNCPGRNAVAVAELAFGLILSLDRRIPDNVADLRAGRWDKKGYGQAHGLSGATLGLLGFGSIAQELARRAQAFGLNLVIWSRRFAGQPDMDLAGYGLDPVRRDVRVVIADSPGADRRAGRHPEHPPGPQRGNPWAGQPGRPRPASIGRIRHQYGAGRAGRLCRPGRGHPRARHPGRARCLSG